MRKIGTLEAKTRLSHWLNLAEGGEEVIITRHGRPVAKLIPANPDAPAAVWRTLFARVDQLKFRLPAGECVTDLIRAGRRF